MAEAEGSSIHDWRPPEGYAGSVVRGGAWNVLGTSVGYLLTLVRSAVLARLLAPEHFGSFSLALVALALADVITYMGLEPAVVRLKEIDRHCLCVVWTVNVLRGLALAAVLWAAAPWVGVALGSDRVPVLLRWGALAPAVQGLASPALVLLALRMKFGRLTAYGLFTQAIAVVSTVLVAWKWPGDAALLAGYLIAAVVGTLLSYVAAPFLPGLNWSRKLLGELYRFGRHVVGLRISGVIVYKTDDALIGRWLGSAQLGYYSMAYNVVSLPVNGLVIPCKRVFYSAFCRIQDEAERFRAALVRTVSAMAGIGLPVMLGLAVLATEAVVIYLGPKWEPAGSLAAVFAVAGCLRMLSSPVGTWIMAAGRPHRLMLLRLIDVPLFIAALVFLIPRAGTMGAAAALTGFCLFELVAYLAEARRIQAEAVPAVLRVIAPPLAASLVMVGGVWLLRRAMCDSGLALRTCACVILGAVLYLLVTFLINRRLLGDVADMWKAVRAGFGRT